MSNKADRLRILHVIPSVSARRGGPSKAIIEMVNALRAINIDAEIATTNDNGSGELDVELNKLIKYQGAPIRFFKRYSPRLSAVREFAYSASLAVWLRAHIRDYDVIHIHAIFSYSSTYAMNLARKNKVPYILRPIGQLEGWSLEQSKLKKALYLKAIEKTNIEAASAVHFTAESERDHALSRFQNIVPKVIPHGIHLPALIPNAYQLAFEHLQIDQGVPCLAYLSRVHPKKGLEFLIHALAQLKQTKAQLVIAGDGEPEYLKQLSTLSASLGVERQCHFIGFIEGEQKNILLQRANLFCLTSYSENFGIAVLEAMANGTPPLISREVALSNEVAHKALGFVCDLNENAISTKLSLALSDINRTNEVGERARDFVAQHYQWNSIAQRLASLYKQLKEPS